MRILTLLAASLTVITAFAADPPKPAKSPLMTRAELRDCMARQDRVRRQTDATAQAKRDLDAQKAEVARQEEALKTELTTLDRTSADAVAGYNAKVQARDKLIDDYNNGGPAFNAGVEALQTERAAYAKACENRRFDEKDEIAIKKGL